MSKIKFQGNASGTGVLTITSPNTNADRTITLPDEDVTLGGGVDGIVSNADATAMTITSSENIGIGTASPTQKLHVAGNIYNTGYLNTAGSGTAGGVQFADGNAMIYRDTNDMVFKLQGAEKIRLPSSGGITFNGDTAAANALDDYEEGTFTLSIQDWSDATFSMGTVTAAKYTKVGNVVHIWVNTLITSSASNPSSGDLKLSGFPFSSQGNNAVLVPVKFGHTGTAVLSYHPRFQYYGSAGYFYGQNSSGVDGTITHIFNTSTRIGLNFSYMVS